MSQFTQQLRITVKDLPSVEALSEQEQAETFGAGVRRARLGIEELETRELMAATITASLTGGVLRVERTPGADQIRVFQTGDQLRLDGRTIQTANRPQNSVAARSVSRIECGIPLFQFLRLLSWPGERDRAAAGRLRGSWHAVEPADRGSRECRITRPDRRTHETDRRRGCRTMSSTTGCCPSGAWTMARRLSSTCVGEKTNKITAPEEVSL